jgi:hypothetical protein
MEQDNFQSHVIDSLARLETNMKDLVGNGQPGRVKILENEVSSLKKARWTFAGIIVGATAVISALINIFFKH